MVIILIPNSVVLVTKNDKSSIQESTSLVEAAELNTVSVITRKKIGEGKYGISENAAFEVAEVVEQEECEFVVINSHLKTTQLYNLAKVVKVKVFDREELILEIFSRRASTAEAKLQVELARLRYELPRSKEKVRLAKASEQPGFFGLGKYDLDTGRPQYNGVNYITDSDTSLHNHTTSLDYYVGINEPLLAETINRPLNEIYKLQLKLMDMCVEKYTNKYPAATQCVEVS